MSATAAQCPRPSLSSLRGIQRIASTDGEQSRAFGDKLSMTRRSPECVHAEASIPQDLDVAIVSYNTRQLTLDCLGSVYRELAGTGLDARVWVVDNASSDGSADAVRAGFPQAMLFASERNMGYAGGVNAAIERIASQPLPRLVLFLNPDTLVRPGSLSTLWTFLDEHPRVGVAGPQLAFADGSFQHSAFRFPTLAMVFLEFWPVNHRLLDSRLNGRYPHRWYASGHPFSIDHPLGAAMMVRWQTIEDVGPMDEGYFMYCEEVDWCMRIARAGWGIYCVPEARIVHLGGQSTRQFRDDMFVALWRSRFRLFERHRSPLYRGLARRIVRAGMRKEMGSLKRAILRGAVTEENARSRLSSYRQVLEL